MKVREFEQRLHELVPKAIKRLEALLASDNDRVALQAAEIVMHRCYGPPADSGATPYSEELNELING